MPEQRYEQVILPSSGSVAGIPGHHGPGSYMVDWQERTIVTLTEWEEAQARIAKEADENQGVAPLETSTQLS